MEIWIRMFFVAMTIFPSWLNHNDNMLDSTDNVYIYIYMYIKSTFTHIYVYIILSHATHQYLWKHPFSSWCNIVALKKARRSSPRCCSMLTTPISRRWRWETMARPLWREMGDLRGREVEDLLGMGWDRDLSIELYDQFMVAWYGLISGGTPSKSWMTIT